MTFTAYSSETVAVTRINGALIPSSLVIRRASRELKAGSEWSERMISGWNSCNARTKSGLSTTTFFSKSNFAFLSIRSTNSASAARSSRCSIFKGRSIWVMVLLFGYWQGRLVGKQPIHAQLAYRTGKSFEVHRLDHIAVHPQLIAVDDVLFFFGRGHDNDRNGFAGLAGFQLSQHFDPVHFWHFYIQ